MTRLVRAATVLAVMIAAVLAVGSPAAAHTELLGTTPAQASMVTAPIEEVTLTFSGPVRADGSSVIITGPDGQDHRAGPLSVVDFVVHQPVASLPSGAYQVAWTVIAGDGHPLTGEFTFELALPPELEPAPTASPETTATASPETTASEAPGDPTTATGADSTSDGGPVAWWILAVVGAVAVALAGGLLARRAARGRR